MGHFSDSLLDFILQQGSSNIRDESYDTILEMCTAAALFHKGYLKQFGDLYNDKDQELDILHSIMKGYPYFSTINCSHGY